MLNTSPYSRTFLRDVRARENEAINVRNLNAHLSRGAWVAYLDLAFIRKAVPHTLFKLNNRKVKLKSELSKLQCERKDLIKKQDDIKYFINRVCYTNNNVGNVFLLYFKFLNI